MWDRDGAMAGAETTAGGTKSSRSSFPPKQTPSCAGALTSSRRSIHWAISTRATTGLPGCVCTTGSTERTLRRPTPSRACKASTWWCFALVGYANHLLGNAAAAESAFTSALDGMPEDERCKWREISVLLPPNTRHYYEGLTCAARKDVEDGYWILGGPRL